MKTSLNGSGPCRYQRIFNEESAPSVGSSTYEREKEGMF